MKTLIVANWKMNPSTEKEAEALFKVVKKGVKGVKNVEVVICPPFIYLPLFAGLTLGAQNVFYKEQGAFTGEVSPLQLKDLHVKYVIIGHSEARKYLGETNEIINRKIREVLSVGLIPIFCVGENTAENKAEVLTKQITEGLQRVPAKEFKNIIIAYEPIWAIGTGKNCSVQETRDSIVFIKGVIEKLHGDAKSIRILYGGSVTSKNSSPYMKDADADGLLVGGDSLNAEDFVRIVASAT